VCPECAEPLPYGRLACPSCGALLASVGGTSRRVEPGPMDGMAEEPLLIPDEPPMLAPDAADEPSAPDAADAADAPFVPDAADAPDEGAQADEPVPPSAEREVATLAAPPESAPAWREPGAIPSLLREWPLPSEPEADEAAAATRAEPEPVAQTATADAAPAPEEEPYQPAGAYLPPSAVFLPDASVAPASVASASAALTSPSADPKAKPRRPGDAPLLADLPLDAPDDLPGWLVAGGAIAGTIGFFLPWAHRVIGASGEGYLSSWGFGALMNVPIFIAVFVTLALAVMPNRVPVWLRTGVLPLATGGLLLGTVWPYVLYGPLNGRLGSVIEAFAGLLLVVGGLLAVRASRHAGTPPSV
ncbi:MAG TPA: hypothetical protein VFR14_09475, partial [Candidatus Limnocylindrales bacterium]|nr:hypothetical protein [Candidatus Limnocylindrales bacterium]